MYKELILMYILQTAIPLDSHKCSHCVQIMLFKSSSSENICAFWISFNLDELQALFISLCPRAQLFEAFTLWQSMRRPLPEIFGTIYNVLCMDYCRCRHLPWKQHSNVCVFLVWFAKLITGLRMIQTMKTNLQNL